MNKAQWETWSLGFMISVIAMLYVMLAITGWVWYQTGTPTGALAPYQGFGIVMLGLEACGLFCLLMGRR